MPKLVKSWQVKGNLCQPIFVTLYLLKQGICLYNYLIAEINVIIVINSKLGQPGAYLPV